ncbi:restriction endonuclease [Acinetobacter sp. YH16032]|uniref:restriction endonuclease n=1 Tax=Acinetobacter sp. YH16032 TaxID=2601181 RepID=UPI0015D1709B|nr:restriction endonuclease [Acinetobacter sp. YH16032]
MKKYLMVRSPESLIKENRIGYGWKQVNFSLHQNIKTVIQEIIEKNGSIGRMTNQVKNYFELKSEDIVIVPLGKKIAIAKVIGTKKYDPLFKGGHGANQIDVEFFRKDGKVIYIPRSKLKENLESRLKLRTTIGDLTRFSQEIDHIIQNLKDLGDFDIKSSFQEKIDQYENEFKTELLNALWKGNTRLKAGGRGLEELIKELLEIQGYSSVLILDKKNGEGIADIDIEATSENNPFLKNILVQVKHHRGETDKHAINQLIAYEEEIGIRTYKWVITTGYLSKESKEFAELNQVNIMEGEQLVDWIYANLSKLKSSTKEALGIVDVPKLSWV